MISKFICLRLWRIKKEFSSIFNKEIYGINKVINIIKNHE